MILLQSISRNFCVNLLINCSEILRLKCITRKSLHRFCFFSEKVIQKWSEINVFKIAISISDCPCVINFSSNMTNWLPNWGTYLNIPKHHLTSTDVKTFLNYFKYLNCFKYLLSRNCAYCFLSKWKSHLTWK